MCPTTPRGVKCSGHTRALRNCTDRAGNGRKKVTDMTECFGFHHQWLKSDAIANQILSGQCSRPIAHNVPYWLPDESRWQAQQPLMNSPATSERRLAPSQSVQNIATRLCVLSMFFKAQRFAGCPERKPKDTSMKANKGTAASTSLHSTTFCHFATTA